MFLHRLHAAVLLLVLTSANGAAEDHGPWPHWRGPGDSGSTTVGRYPETLDKSSMRWQFALPGKGCSTPIVLDQTIYVTAPADGNDALFAIDWSGQQRWRTVFGPENAGKHRNGSGSNASPVTDGSAVFAYFKSGTLAAVELDGSVRWKTNLVERFGEDTLYWDHGTSPVITDKYVIMARMHTGDSWLAAFDKTSGELAWKVARNYTTPTECDHGYTTPLVIEHNGRETLLVWGAQHLTMHAAANGELIWTCGNFNPDANAMWPAIASPVIVGDVAVICFGRNDRGQPRLHGIRLDGNGDVTSTNHLWQRDDIGSFVPTPAADGKHVYLVGDSGKVECLDPISGKTVWNDAFPKNRAKYYASPLIADGKLYAPREDGVVFVASVADNRFALLSENDLEESVIGSPVPAESCLFIRGEKHLFCFASPDTFE